MRTMDRTAQEAKRILVIEDNLDFIAPLSVWLRRGGYLPTMVRSRDDALNTLLSEQFRYILMDHNMPGMPAEHFVDLIRKIYPRSIFVLLTGSPDAFEISSSLGISYVLQKPFTDNDLCSLIDRVATANTMLDTD